MEPTQEQWINLYQAANKIKKQKPWQWMTLGQIFAITDPQSGINYYCSVQSEEQIDYIQILIGEDGLNRILSLTESISRGLEYDEEDDTTDAINGLASYMLNFDEHSLNCLFTDKTYLSNWEMETLQSLGLSFRGHKQWIAFRYLQAGRLAEPLLSAEQALLLTMLLEQISQICALEKRQPFLGNLLHHPTATTIFCWRYLEASNQWEQTSIPIETVMAQGKMVFPINQLDTLKVRHLKGSQRIYELIRMYLPMPVEHNGILLFPLTFLLVDMDNGMIVWNYIDAGDKNYEQRLIDKLAAFFFKEGVKPSRILTADYVLHQILTDFCDKSRIFLEFLVYTIAGDEILESFQESTHLTYDALASTIEEVTAEKHLLDYLLQKPAPLVAKPVKQRADVIDIRTKRPLE